MEAKNHFTTYIWIAVAAILWGTIGPFMRTLSEIGLSANAIAFIRMFFGSLLLSGHILFTDRRLFRITAKDLLICAVLGLVTQTGFNLAYVRTVQLIGVSFAAVLLYISPLFLLMGSLFLFKEKQNGIKIAGVFLCVLGAALAVTGGNLNQADLSIEGVLMGILSALTYAIMTLASRLLLKRLHSLTLITYCFLFGALFTLPTLTSGALLPLFATVKSLSVGLGMGLIPAAMAYIFYFKAMERQPDLAIVGVLTTLELIFSLLFAGILFGERLGPVNLVGVGCILLAITLSQLGQLKSKKPTKSVLGD